MKKSRPISATPRAHQHSRKVHFSISMREKISQNWIEVRKKMASPSTKKNAPPKRGNHQ